MRTYNFRKALLLMVSACLLSSSCKEKIEAFVDGNSYFVYDDNSSDLSWPFSKLQNIILNLAKGGGWGGAQGMNEHITSQKMIIDYVKVYECK